MKAIILISEASLPLAKTLQRELPDTLIYTKNECEALYFHHILPSVHRGAFQ